MVKILDEIPYSYFEEKETAEIATEVKELIEKEVIALKLEANVCWKNQRIISYKSESIYSKAIKN